MKQVNGSYPQMIFEGRLTTFINENPPIQIVSLNGKPIDQRQDLEKHSEGVSWGYGGAGPHQLALALTAHALGDVIAKKWYHVVLEKIVSKLNQETGWALTEYNIWMCVYFHSPDAKADVERFS